MIWWVVFKMILQVKDVMLEEEDTVVIIASDGVWDVTSPEVLTLTPTNKPSLLCTRSPQPRTARGFLETLS